MNFTSTSKMNCLYWITSLHEGEQGVTCRVWENLEAMAGELNLVITKYAPASAEDFLAVMDQIIADARMGMLPMIHLDTHGSAKDGILIAGTREYVSWEILAEKFRSINKIVGNNLCVISLACFSFHIIKAIDINRVSPFFMLLAPEYEIKAGDIEDNVVGFYQETFRARDILAAQDAWFPTQLRVFHCERMLAIVLARYINDAAMGKQKERRKEELITKAVEGGIVPNRHNLRAARKLAETGIKPTEELINRFLPIFLAGKKPGFTVAELKVMVEKGRSNGLKPVGKYA
jgi:hypothetical protein